MILIYLYAQSVIFSLGLTIKNLILLNPLILGFAWSMLIAVLSIIREYFFYDLYVQIKNVMKIYIVSETLTLKRKLIPCPINNNTHLYYFRNISLLQYTSLNYIKYIQKMFLWLYLRPFLNFGKAHHLQLILFVLLWKD